MTAAGGPADPDSIRVLCATIDRLAQLVELLIERESVPAKRATPTAAAPLTPRELEVARLIVEGLSTSRIAERLVLEPATIKTFRRSLGRKLGGSDRKTLTAKRAAWEVEAGVAP